MGDIEVPKENHRDVVYKIVKLALGSIPVPYAGSIAELFSLVFAEPISKRKEMWMEMVAIKLCELEEKNASIINHLKENEEFISFILECSQIAIKLHQKEKLDVLKNTIGNFFLIPSTDYDKKYSFLKVVDVITPTHLKILDFIFRNETLIIEKIGGFALLYENYVKDEPIDKFYFRKCVYDLENESLIRISKDFKDFFSGGGYSTDTSAPAIKVLDFGREFIEFIKEN